MTNDLHPEAMASCPRDCEMKKSSALFLSKWGNRITRTDVYEAVTDAAERVGLHHSESDRTFCPTSAIRTKGSFFGKYSRHQSG